MGHIWKNSTNFEERLTLRKMGHTFKNAKRLQQWFKSHLEHGPNLAKWVILKNMGHTLKKLVSLKKTVTFGKMGHTWKIGSH